jgi:hypothetical protein
VLKRLARQSTGDFMNTKRSLGQKAIAQQVRTVIDTLDRTGSTTFPAGAAKPDFRTVTITISEGDALRRWVLHENASQTIEIGLAFGFSALHICEALLLNGNPDPRHVTLDPWQTSAYANRGAARARSQRACHPP